MNEQSCWDEVLRATPEAMLAIRRAAFHQLLSGRPALIDRVADEAGLSTEAAREALDLVVSVGMAEVDDGTIVGIHGSRREGRVTASSSTASGCGRGAPDIVGIAAAVGAEAVGRTQCGACGLPIEVLIREGQPERSTAVGWLPDESCANVMAEFCPSALLFCSRAHLDEWRTGQASASGAALDIETLAERGRSFWRRLVP